MYIGKSKIKTFTQEGDEVLVLFKDKTSRRFQSDLFDLIKSKGKGIGDVNTNISSMIASIFLQKMAGTSK